MKIVLLIRALRRGGAERQLVTLAEGLARRGHAVHVLSFYAGGELVGGLARAGVGVRTADKGGRWDMAGFLARLVRTLKEIGPDVLYSSMPAANIAGALAGRLAGRPRIVWRVASSEMDLSRYHWFSGLSYRVEAWCASIPGVIVANSYAGRDAVVKRGFDRERVKVVWNGIRTDVFAPDAAVGAELRKKLGLDERKWTIGQVARSDPKKGYEDFLEAAAMLAGRRGDVQFLCVGVDAGDYADRLEDLARRMGMADRVTWLGMQEHMTPVYNAMDINTLSSRFGEGCPNAVAEAMACGVPCVVTDVGDSGVMVGRSGEVVAPRSADQLMRGWTRLLNRLEKDPEAVKAGARQRIVESFSVERYVDETEQLLLGSR